MDISLRLHEFVLYGLILVIICIYATKYKAKRSRKAHHLPPEPAGAWPIIGHLHLLGANQLLHRKLSTIADEYGPIFGMRLGANRAVVISSWEVAKECFTVNDKVLSSRPKPLAAKISGYDNFNPGFASYGPYWREFRKLTASQLLSNQRLELRKHVRDTEVNYMIEGLYKKCVENGGRAVVEMKERFGHLAINIVLRSVAGKRFDGADDESRRCLKAFCDFNRLLGLFSFSDAIPILGWLDVINGSVSEMKRTARELDYFLGKWVQEHRRKKNAGEIDEKEQDFMDVMLSALDDGRPAHEVDTTIKGTCLGLFAGGSDSTVITLTWALSLLLNNSHVLKKAQDELNIHIGKHRQVDELDINNLTYIKAIIKETLRLCPPAPLSVPREAMEDCTVAGFHIPKGTQILVNLWKLHRDPSIWKNPSEFTPERFIEEHANVDVRGQDFEYLPFGSGRRMCPGVTFGTQVLHLAMARLLHAFEFTSVENKPIDMTEGPGLTLPKETPLEVIVTPRLPEALYVAH